MGYALIWIAGLATALLLVVLAAALAGRRPSGLLRWVQGGAGILAVLGATVLPLMATAYLRFGPGLEHSWFAYVLSWAVCFLGGGLAILWVGLRQGAAPMPRAAFWPRGKLLAGFAAGLALTFMTFWNLDLAAQNQAAALRVEAGQLALSVAPVRLPERQNAAPLYRQAFDAMERVERPKEYEAWTAWCREEGAALPTPDDPSLTAYLAAQGPALALLREAAARPGCYFERDYARPSVDMQLPELMPFVNAGRLLALEAGVRAAEGRAAEALRDVEALFRMAAHGRAEPMTISALVSMTIDDMGVRALAAVLAAARPDAAALESLDLGPPPEYSRGLGRTLRAEEAFGLWTLADLTLEENIDLLGLTGVRVFPAGLRSVYRVFLLPGEVRGYRTAMRRYRDLAAKPFPEAARETDASAVESEVRRAGLFSSLFVPTLTAIFERGARADAQHDLARVALAAARFRAETGAPPASLDALVPKYLALVPRDPFDGKPLRLAATDDSLILYSVGPDKVDDGGAPLDREEKTGDLAFRLPR